MQFGETSIASDHVSTFIGGQGTAPPLNTIRGEHEASAVSTRSADLDRLYVKYTRASSSHERMAAGEALQKELAMQLAVEDAYTRLTKLAFPDDVAKQQALRRDQQQPQHADCELSAHASFRIHCGDKFDANSGFALQFHQVVVNVCAEVARGLNFDVSAAAQQSCQEEQLVV